MKKSILISLFALSLMSCEAEEEKKVEVKDCNCWTVEGVMKVTVVAGNGQTGTFTTYKTTIYNNCTFQRRELSGSFPVGQQICN
jgi:hypothetical protein